MSKKEGTMFSKSLFGYNKEDVNEYIRQSDVSHSSVVEQLKQDNELLNEKLDLSEKRVAELEKILDQEKEDRKEWVREINSEHAKRLAEAVNNYNLLKAKLASTESRATSYLKLADTLKARSETSEAECTILSASLDEANSAADELRKMLKEKDDEIKRLTELEIISRRNCEERDREAIENKKKYLLIKKPKLNWIGKKK